MIENQIKRIEKPNVQPIDLGPQQPTNSTLIENLEKQLKETQKKLEETTASLQKQDNYVHELIKIQHSQKLELYKSVREIKKLQLMNLSSVKTIKNSIQLVAKRDQEISKLRHILNEFNALHGKALIEELKNKTSPELDAIYLKLFSSYKNQLFLKRMTENELNSTIKWEARRNQLIQEEKKKIMGTLEAMCFITEYPGKVEQNDNSDKTNNNNNSNSVDPLNITNIPEKPKTPKPAKIRVDKTPTSSYRELNTNRSATIGVNTCRSTVSGTNTSRSILSGSRTTRSLNSKRVTGQSQRNIQVHSQLSRK